MKRRKGKRAAELTDRLSELPDAILHHIFCFIGTIDAVRTCVLSKRWRYFWTSLPSLSFHTDSMDFKNYYESYDSQKAAFVNIINRVIARRDPVPIIKFRYVTQYDIEGNVVESWMRYAIEHKVQQFQMIIHDGGRQFVQFPTCFYECESITTLELDGTYAGSIELPKSFNLPSLKSLFLQRFDNFDGSIFSTCPNLENLKLQEINGHHFPGLVFSICALKLKSLEIIQHLGMYPYESDAGCSCKIKIIAPKLMKFKYEGGAPFNCSTENLISLEQVDILVDHPVSSFPCCKYSDDADLTHARYLFDMLNQFHNAKSIELCSNAIKYLCLIQLTVKKHPSPFTNLKYLKVRKEWLPWSRKFSVRCIPDCILTYFLENGGIFQIVD